ncbi:MAG: tributyrin esterase [Methanothrix sp.]|nr:tributyrin esterase [Methanothrix sp.]
MIEIQASGEKCLGDFTFDFYWQHQGSRLDKDQTVSGISFRRMVEALSQGETVRINGDAGSRLGSSLGVDLLRLGGKGGPIENTGKIVVEGNVGSRMGISMLRGSIYVSGRVELPLGNVIEVESDLTGFRKFISITEALEKGSMVLEPNILDKRGLIISDGLLRDTPGARNPADKTIRIEGDAGMSTGILMRCGQILVLGDADRNTGVLMQGGRILVSGKTGDFTGTEMRGGEVFVEGDAGKFTCARMRGGAVYAKSGKPLPPAREQRLSSSELTLVARALELAPFCAMMYSKFSL